LQQSLDRGALAGTALAWLQGQGQGGAADFDAWAVLAEETFRACSVLQLVAGGEDGAAALEQELELAVAVLAQGGRLVNPSLPAQQPPSSSSSSSSPSLLSARLVSHELKTGLFARAIEVVLLRGGETGGGDLQQAQRAVEAALLGRAPTTIRVSTEPAAADAVYVDWLLRYVQLALLREGEAGWVAACGFVEERCFSSRPHCVAALALDRYYQQVVQQAMTLLRGCEAGAEHFQRLDVFTRGLVQGAVARCGGNAAFLEAEEELARLAGRHDQANHTRWKRGRAL
jgi:hypothetical protein